MATLFTNILIPVDFSENTDVAVQKAIELIVPVNSIVHLLHVTRQGIQFNGCHLNGHFMSPPISNTLYNEEAEINLELCKKNIQASFPFINVITHIATGGNIQERIIEMVNKLNVQLIIIGKTKSRKWFSFFNTVDTSLIAKKTNSGVLTIKNGSLPGRIRSIVLPVRSFVPDKKIELLSAVTQKHKPIIHLVTTHNKAVNKTRAFLDTYRTISDYMHYPIQYKMLEGDNFPKAIFDYARFTMADMILVNPYEETRINSIYGRDICDLISPTSNLTVLKTEPSH